MLSPTLALSACDCWFVDSEFDPCLQCLRPSPSLLANWKTTLPSTYAEFDLHIQCMRPLALSACDRPLVNSEFGFTPSALANRKATTLSATMSVNFHGQESVKQTGATSTAAPPADEPIVMGNSGVAKARPAGPPQDLTISTHCEGIHGTTGETYRYCMAPPGTVHNARHPNHHQEECRTSAVPSVWSAAPTRK